MNVNLFMSADAAGGGLFGGNQWIMIVVLVVLMVGMFAMSIIPQKKRQKKAQEMMNSISVGTKVKTIGGFVGDVRKVDNNNGTFTLDISANGDGSMMVVIDKSAIYTVLEAVKNSEGVTTIQEKPEVTAMDDLEADKLAESKKSSKNKKDGIDEDESFKSVDSLEKQDNETLLKD